MFTTTISSAITGNHENECVVIMPIMRVCQLLGMNIKIDQKPQQLEGNRVQYNSNKAINSGINSLANKG